MSKGVKLGSDKEIALDGAHFNVRSIQGND